MGENSKIGTSVEARALQWAVSRDTGSSSKALCAHMSGGKSEGAADYPHDPDDLGRCLRLLQLVPEWKSRIAEMAVYGAGWAGLVKIWPQIAAAMADEVGIDLSRANRAPQTYRLMQLAIADGYRNDPTFKCMFRDDGTLRWAERVSA